MGTPIQNPGHACPILPIVIDHKNFTSKNQFITGAELKHLAGIKHEKLFLAIENPWDDEEIHNYTSVDLARPGIEHFYSGTKRVKIVEIKINHVDYEISKGNHTATEIKTLGKIPPDYELEQIIDGKFTPIEDDSVLSIKGCELFIGHVKSGKSS